VELPAVTVCGQQARPLAQPPEGSGPVILYIAPCFEAQGGASVIESQTYLYYIQLKPSSPSQGYCFTDTAATEKIIQDDFHRLNTNFLDNLFVEVTDLQVPQRDHRQGGDLQHGGAAARQDRRLHRIEKGRDFEDRREAEEANTQIRLDTFIDPALVRKVEGIVRDMLRRRDSVRHRQAEIKEVKAGRSWCTSPSRWKKVPRSKSARSISWATRR
jgi:hypothetical protein